MRKAIIWSSVIIIFFAVFLLLGLHFYKVNIEKNSGASVKDKEKSDLIKSEESSKKSQVSLNFTYWGNFNEKRVIDNICSGFSKKYPHIKVEAVQLSGNYTTQMLVMNSSNNLPDIGYMLAELGNKWVNEEKFVNIFDILASDDEIKKEDFLDYIWFRQSPEYAWGIASAGECFGLYYNKTLFETAGIDSLPSKAEDAMNWDKFLDTARKLTLDINGRNAYDENFDFKHIKQYGIMFDINYSPALNNFIFGNGGEWISADGKEFILNKPEGVEAIQKLADLINVYHVAPTPSYMRSLSGLTDAFEAGLCAMMVGGQWINIDLSNGKVKYDIGVFPKMKKSLTVGYSGATVLFKSSKHIEEAWLFMKQMADPDASIEPYSSGLWMPVKKKWYTDPELIAKWVDANPAAHPPGFKDAMMNQLIKNGVPSSYFYMKNRDKIIPPVLDSLKHVWNGSKTANEVLNEVAKKIQPTLN